MSETTKAAKPPITPDELMQLARRAEKGDASVLPVLTNAMDNGAYIESVGNLALQVQRSIIEKSAGVNLLFKEAIARKMAQIRKELTQDDSTALEKLLVERIVTCWLSLNEAEVRFAQHSDLSYKQISYWQDRIDRLHRRYLSSIKTLATVRKLALPVLQVNIARKQVNVAGSAA